MPCTYVKILNDVKTLIGNAVPDLRTIVRKTIIRFANDPLPLCLIVPFHEATVSEAFEGQVQIDYAVGIALIFAGNMELESGLADMIDLIDTLRKTLHVTSLPTASGGSPPFGVFDSQIDMNPPFDAKALTQANLDYSLMEVTYRSGENRN